MRPPFPRSSTPEEISWTLGPLAAASALLVGAFFLVLDPCSKGRAKSAPEASAEAAIAPAMLESELEPSPSPAASLVALPDARAPAR